MRTSWKVGLATDAFDPVPRATPRTKVVLPAPSSPLRRTTSPPRNCSPSTMPERSVSAGELVICSSKVVVAGLAQGRADDLHILRFGHLADDVHTGLGDFRRRSDGAA